MNSERISHVQGFRRGEKAIFILLVLFIHLCIFVPVWQAGENRSLSMRINESKKTVAQLSEQERVLQARVAKARMPEGLTGTQDDLVFTRITPDGAVRIASASLEE